ncbi:MAG: Eco57I restriction-modification methylase domain-containing protein [Candidatus Helarchaeota archaeon]
MLRHIESIDYNEKIKKLGQNFTNIEIVKFMIKTISKNKDDLILEPSAGKGIFINELFKQGFSNVDAYEIDSSLIENFNLIKNEDFLNVKIEEKYDCIIGNPPYVRYKNLIPYFRNKLSNEKYWKNKINTMGDLLYCFLFKCVDMLKDGGELIFITPFFWTQSKYATELREFMLNKGFLDYIIHFGEFQLFDKVNTNNIIFKYIKRKKKIKGKKKGNIISILEDENENNSKERFKVKRYFKYVDIKMKKGNLNEILGNVIRAMNQLNDKNVETNEILESFRTRQPQSSYQWNFMTISDKKKIKQIENACKLISPIIKVKSTNRNRHLYRECKLTNLFSPNHFKRYPRLKKNEFEEVRTEWNRKYFLLKNKNFQHMKYRRFLELGDIMRIGAGLVTGLDAAFKLNEEEIKNLNDSEKKFVLKFVKGPNMKRFFTEGYTQYLYLDEIESEEELETNYPNIFRKIAKYKDKLRKRYMDWSCYGKKWYVWSFPRNIDLYKNNNPGPKIFIPSKDRQKLIRFSYNDGICYSGQDSCIIVLNKHIKIRENIFYILAWINSEFIDFWYSKKGIIRGAVRQFSNEGLERIPVLLIDWDKWIEVDIHNRIVELVQKIRKERSEEPYISAINNLFKKLINLKYDLKY